MSLRSCKYVDVSKVAAFFGGGGHMRAAGCTINGTFYDVVNNISKQIAIQMKAYDEKMTQEITCILNEELEIPAKNIYVTYHGITDWGISGHLL